MTRKRLGWGAGFGGGIRLALAAGILVAASAGLLAQAMTSTASLVGADGKPLTFDVISIREDKSEPGPRNPAHNGPTPDGYHLKALPLYGVIQMAYLPSEGGLPFRPNRIMGVPAWASYSSSTRYDIDAKVSEADLPRWRDPALQPAMLRAMLQAMLADRFKAVIHRETKTIPIYEMTLGKKAPKFKLAEATTLEEIRRKHPDVVTLRSGTFVVVGPNPGQQTLFGVSMQDLGTFLSVLAGRPIQDKTGLMGRYDVTYQMELRPPPQEDGKPAPVPPDFFNAQISNIVESQLGLKLRAAKGPEEMLVIDHVKQPSEN